MVNIDYIMGLLDGSNPEDEQNKGLELAKDVKCINVFMQPKSPYGKRVWENCAKVLSTKSDDELKIYFADLFMWLQDMTWPGAYIIYDRLLSASNEEIEYAYKISAEDAKQTNDTVWQKVLQDFYADYIANKNG